MNSRTRRKPKTVLAVDKNGQEIFVKLSSSGISPLVAMIDGLTLTYFGKGKTAYLRVQTALEWFEKELSREPWNKTYQEAIAAYRRILEKFKSGEVTEAS